MKDRLFRLIRKLPFLLKLFEYYRNYWNAYQLREHSLSIASSVYKYTGAKRLPISLIAYESAFDTQTHQTLQAWQTQLTLPEDEIILIGSVGMQNKLSAASKIKYFEGEVNLLGSYLNTAIQSAQNSLMVVTDLRILPSIDWIETISQAFQANPEAEYALGQITPANSSMMIALHGSDLKTFSYRIIAIRKQVWARAGGFPALFDADTALKIFHLRLKDRTRNHLIVRAAQSVLIDGLPRPNLWTMAFRAAQHEGELGLFAPHFWNQAWHASLTLFLILTGLILIPFSLLLGSVVLAMALVVSPILMGRPRPVETVTIPRSRVNRWLGGWIQIVRWLGYARGVAYRAKSRAKLEGEAVRQLKEAIGKHPSAKGILLFSSTVDWTYMFQRYHQYARQFARRNYLVFYHTKNAQTDAYVGFQEVEPRLFVTPAPLETFGGLEHLIFYINSPWLLPIIEWLKHPVILYDHCDDIQVSSGTIVDHHSLLKQAETVMASSRKLFDEDRSIRADTLYMPNAVDYDWVQQFAPAHGETPPNDLAPILQKGKPVIGYTGALAEWFDYELLTDVCRQCPDMEFVLIGNDYDGTIHNSELLQCENLTWLGIKPYQSLFQYTWRFDATIIPFRVNQITIATSPVKLFEYFACQKAVISTPLPECRNYAEVFIGNTADEFAVKLREALRASHKPQFTQRLIEIARQNTWESRVSTILEKLENKI